MFSGRSIAFSLFFVLVLVSVSSLLADSGRGRHKKIYAVPTPGTVKIDARLDDWDFSGHVNCYIRSETREEKSADFAVMYDDEALYLGARVLDPSPMLNHHSPEADADKAWMGDCCQFRLVTDRTLPFPFLRGALGNANKGAEEGQPLHLMLWYFTDEKKPALQVHKSFAMEPVRKEWAPHGVVPATHFDAAYRKHPEGKSYTFEYRIPWSSLNAKKKHPVAGDVVNATVQFLWSGPNGLRAKGGVVYDVMSRGGFPWQTSGVWGKMVMRSEGNVDRKWVEPFEPPKPPRPLEFEYDLPEDGVVSVALYKDKKIVRHIVAEGKRKAGHVVEKWNGRDRRGEPLPTGTYRWKGLYHDPITTRYVMSVGNSGNPPYKTADGTGGWGGDYGPPSAACVAGDRMILGWTAHENGWGIIATDLDGNKIWGAKQKNAAFLATDGNRFFAPAERGGKRINVYAVKNGQPLVYGNGLQGLKPPETEKKDVSTKPTGVGYARGKLYVSYRELNTIGVYDADEGNLGATWNVKSPGRIAASGEGGILVISGTRLVRVKDGKPEDFATTHIDEPAGVAIGPRGKVYVANHGKLQSVSVFTPEGKYLRSIGKRGGRPLVGPWDKKGMRRPAGIAVDGEGKLWVPEAINSPKRLSVWHTSSGKLLEEYFGACSYSPFMWIDPANPSEAFFDNTIWDIDLEKGTWYPKSVFYRRTSRNMVHSGNGGFHNPFRVFTAGNGHQYAISSWHGFGPVLWIRRGNRFRPTYFMFKNHPNPVLIPRPPFKIMKDEEEYPPGHYYFWADENRDMVVQKAEITEIPGSWRNRPPYFNWMDKGLNLYGNGAVYRPGSIGEDGVPVYDFKNPEKLDVEHRSRHTWVDPEGKRLWGLGRGSRELGRAISQWDLGSGKMEWAYPHLKTWRAAINEGIPAPGKLIGSTCPLGTAGGYTGVISYFGTANLVRTKDGLFMSQVFEHGARGGYGPNVFYVEFLAGQLLQPRGSDRYYILAGDQDCRINEVLGLDTVKDLGGGKYEYTSEKAGKAAKAWKDYETKIARGQPLAVGRGGEDGLGFATSVGKTLDEKRGFKVQVTYDQKNLYFHYEVKSPSPFVNGTADPKYIFKGGNLLDIQMATDPDADPEREKAAPGDIRLLIGRRDGRTRVVIYRPNVAAFKGEPIQFKSPVDSETFDSIKTTNRVSLKNFRKRKGGFEVIAVVPRQMVGLDKLRPGTTLRMDVGYIFGNAGGTNANQRAYWHNNSFEANVVNDVPDESRLEPDQWGEVLVE
ncbi:MAG: hypothetical protein ACLFWL_03815 [Candidatus Brocadiia bacterium]